MSSIHDTSVSLNKFISNSGRCSRREADRLIEEGRVTLNGKPAKSGNRVVEGDAVTVDGELLLHKPKATYIAFNKPVGIVCTTNVKEPNNIITFIKHEERLFPIGRLDKESQGLIFLTNDGDMVNKILRAGNEHEKEYFVTVDRPFTARFIRQMSEGVEILGTVTKKCEVEQLNKNTFRIVLIQGMNRQIRRMCKVLGYQVKVLTRTRIMNVHLGKLKLGRWRKLTRDEMEGIKALIATSTKTQEGSVKKSKKKRPYRAKRPYPPGKPASETPTKPAGKYAARNESKEPRKDARPKPPGKKTTGPPTRKKGKR